ncbi:MAG: prepilin-type N-terminal cleavage/methylation domain-containing protein [Phycisphaeraceae bacterium]|nr:prepilin-type N-terminal cleavage/methylation domain-containing protein [Phycisphaeraceae bacterium]
MSDVCRNNDVPAIRHPPSAIRHRRPGFTLIEVLIAMGIFLIGVICVAALFPASVALQRQTVESVLGQQVARRAMEQMRTIAAAGVEYSPSVKDPLTYHHDTGNPPNPTGTLADYVTHTDDSISRMPNRNSRVMPLIRYPWGGVVGFGNAQDGYAPEAPVTDYPNNNNRGFGYGIFGLDTCSYPSTNQYRYRDYYWFPFIQISGLDSGGSVSWQGFVIVMHRHPQMLVPQVRYTNAIEDTNKPNGSIGARIDWRADNFDNDQDNDGTPDLIRPGDLILTDTGITCRVILSDKDGCTVDVPVLQANNLTLARIFFVVDVKDGPDADTEPDYVVREGPSPVAWIEGPFSLPVQDPGP